MYILSFRITKVKTAAAIIICGALLITLFVLIPKTSLSSLEAGTSGITVKTNEDRIAYLGSFGWEVNEEPVEVHEIQFPSSLDNTLSNYNEIQKRQGFNLEKYCGKTVKLYSYTVTNYPGNISGEVRANIYVYKNKVIGGDICSTEYRGFMHGFELK